MPEPLQTEKSIFLAAIELEDGADRVAFLEKACGGNPRLRAEIEALVVAHEKPQRLLDVVAVANPSIDPPRVEQVIGPYKLLEQIGEGGSVHEVKLQAGTTYLIDLESKAFDAFLCLEDTEGKGLAEDEDVANGINLNSRLIFTPQTDGIYRLVASAFEASGTGPYTLTIREFFK